MAIATRLSFLGLVAIISGKNLYKSGRDTSLMSSVLAMISTEITMIMAIHVTFSSIVYGLLNRLSVQYPLPNIIVSLISLTAGVGSWSMSRADQKKFSHVHHHCAYCLSMLFLYNHSNDMQLHYIF